MGYLNPTLDHLRGYQEKASAYVLEALGLDWAQGQWPPLPKEAARKQEPEPAEAAA